MFEFGDYGEFFEVNSIGFRGKLNLHENSA